MRVGSVNVSSALNLGMKMVNMKESKKRSSAKGGRKEESGRGWFEEENEEESELRVLLTQS